MDPAPPASSSELDSDRSPPVADDSAWPPLERPRPPRGLIFLASAWLATAWLLTLGWRPPLQAHAASYTPSVRLLLVSLVIGLCIGWPLARLSGPSRAWPIRQAVLDLFVLLCLLQVVVWPLRLVTPWPPSRAAAIDFCLVGWGAATAAIVAVGTLESGSYRATIRVLAMVVAVGLVAAIPAWTVLAGTSLPFSPGGSPRGIDGADAAWWWWASWSPLTAIHALSGRGSVEPEATEWAMARTGFAAAAVLWGGLLALRWKLRRAGQRSGPADRVR